MLVLQQSRTDVGRELQDRLQIDLLLMSLFTAVLVHRSAKPVEDLYANNIQVTAAGAVDREFVNIVGPLATGGSKCAFRVNETSTFGENVHLA